MANTDKQFTDKQGAGNSTTKDVQAEHPAKTSYETTTRGNMPMDDSGIREANEKSATVNPMDELRTRKRSADENVATAKAMLDNAKDKEDLARKEREAAETRHVEAQAAAAAAQGKLDNGQLSDDPQYVKALNEEDGLTLVNADTVDSNATVEKQGSKVYPGNMVIAKRK